MIDRAAPLTRLIRRHPDATALLAILVCGLAARAIVVGWAPVFINKDSVSFFLPGWDLAHGRPPDFEYRRTPGYPLFIALALRLLGDSLLAVALLQHALGLVTALAAYRLGRLAFGRGQGLVAGLLAAVSGPLLMHEHTIMPETLGAALLTVGLLLILQGLRSGRRRWFILAGLTFGWLILARPSFQLVLLCLPAAYLLKRRPLRAYLAPSLLSIASAGLVVAPWLLLVQREHGVWSMGATAGEPLISRTVHGERWLLGAYVAVDQPAPPLSGPWLAELWFERGSAGFQLPDPELVPYPDQLRNEARQLAIKLARKGNNPSDIAEEVRAEFELSRPAADNILKDLALEQLRAQPGYLAQSTLQMSTILFLGRHEGLQIGWTPRRDRAGEAMQDNWAEVARVRPLVQPATPEQRAGYGAVDAVIEIFQPYRFGSLIAVLFLIGAGFALRRSTTEGPVILLLAVLTVLLTSTLASWGSPRYRYPLDPLIYLTAAQGAALVLAFARAQARRRARTAPGRWRVEQEPASNSPSA